MKKNVGLKAMIIVIAVLAVVLVSLLIVRNNTKIVGSLPGEHNPSYYGDSTTCTHTWKEGICTKCGTYHLCKDADITATYTYVDDTYHIFDGKCNVCGVTGNHKVIHVKESTYTKVDNTYHKIKTICKYCKHVFTSSGESEPHDWDEGTVTEAATCTSTGTKKYKCEGNGCTATKTETIEKNSTAHTEEIVTTYSKYNSTQHKVISKYSCCNLQVASELENHSWDNGTVTEAATCTSTGTKTYKCKANGCTATKTESTVKDKSNHTELVTSTSRADSQYHIVITECKGCGEQISNNMIEHTWDSGKITTTPTCIATGVKTYTCTADGCTATKTETISKDSENHVGPLEHGWEPEDEDWQFNNAKRCLEYEKCTKCRRKKIS